MLNKIIKNKQEEILRVRPNINIYSKDEDIVVAVEMPGVDKDTLEVHLEGNNLRISGRKKKDDIAKEYSLISQERMLVEYEREFELNAEIDRENITANYEHGILKVILKKAETAKPRKIDIKV